MTIFRPLRFLNVTTAPVPAPHTHCPCAERLEAENARLRDLLHQVEADVARSRPSLFEVGT